MRILLLCSSFNGLSQRVWTQLRSDGHTVVIQTATDDDTLVRAVARTDPDLILCPFLRERVPAAVWRERPTVILHPGPEGDRGPSSLDWAVSESAPEWGVTALSAVEDMDAGPIWGTEKFPLPAAAARKSDLYSGPVTDAAVSLAREVVAKLDDPTFTPRSLDYTRSDVRGQLRPLMRQADRTFSWADSTAHILRRIRAADGSPGVRTELAGLPVSVFDAQPGAAVPGRPGTIALRRHGAVLVRTGDGAVWIGRARRIAGGDNDHAPRIKLPAAAVLGERIGGVPESLDPIDMPADTGYREISYRRRGAVGTLRMNFHNGAMSTQQCHRLASGLRYAIAQDTSVLVLAGGRPAFANGIHLNVIEASAQPAAEAWRNINAINDVCREIVQCTHQLVVTAIEGNAGAGGVMMGLGADAVLIRAGAVLNPHYRGMGLTGSEYWTYVLPRRVGAIEAERLTSECLPIGAAEAADLGLADTVLPDDPDAFTAAVTDMAMRLATSDRLPAILAAKAAARAADEQRRPLETYRIRELAEMSRDIFDDRLGFADTRHAFVAKTKPRTQVPAVVGRAG